MLDLLEKLEKQYKYVVDYSDFYKNKFKKLKRLNSLKGLEALPFTTKKDLLSNQEENPPFGNNLCVPMNKVIRIHKTSGTTNKPLMIALSKKDIENTIQIGSICFKNSGLKEEDIVINCLNYNMWAGGYTDHQSLEKTQAAVIPFGVGNSKMLIETIMRLKVTAIHCTPSYLFRLEHIMKSEFHLNPVDLKLKLGLFAGESGLQNQGYRKNIEKLWGLKAMNANYGVSEALSIFGAECFCQKGLHFIGKEKLYPELIDIKNNELVPIEKDAVGELVVTNLEKEAQPLIRYRTGDIVKILGNDCICGEKSFRFEIVGRTDDMLVIKGLNVFPSVFEKIIINNIRYISNVYQILINRENPIRRIKLVVERRRTNSMEDKEVEAKILREFAEEVGIKPEIEIVQEGDLPRTEGKSKKILRIL